MTGLDVENSKADTLGSTELPELLRQVREQMRVLDAALEAVGSPREPDKRLDRAPAPPQTTPIFNPATLSY